MRGDYESRVDDVSDDVMDLSRDFEKAPAEVLIDVFDALMKSVCGCTSEEEREKNVQVFLAAVQERAKA